MSLKPCPPASRPHVVAGHPEARLPRHSRIRSALAVIAGLLIACPALASFTDIGAGLTPVGSPAVAWGDFDGDGQLDLVVVGSIMFGVNGNVYRQSPPGTFASSGLPADAGVQSGDVAWGDYDRDGDLDLIIAGDTRDSLINHVYRDDAGTFVNIGAGLVPFHNCAVAWGDFDNDGDLDLALAGNTGSSLVTIVARNDGGVFHDINAGLVGVDGAALAWVDYDKDGDLDLAVTGSPSTDVCTAYLYRNDHGTFVSQPWGVTGMCIGDMAWADYDNDGDLDLVIAGRVSNPPGSATTKLYENQNGTFVQSAVALSPTFICSLAWGDYDNDGWSDLLISGGTGSFPGTSLYHNTHPGFATVSSGIPGVAPAAVAWGDFDGDTRLDVAIAGTTNVTDIARIYHNTGVPLDDPPTVPTGLSVNTASPDSVIFSWNASTDPQGTAGGLSYNLRIGTTPGGGQIMSPMATSTGKRRVPTLGNVQEARRWAIKKSAFSGTFYWSAQAIDQSFVASAFAPEQTQVLAVGDPAGVTAIGLRLASANPMRRECRLDYALPRAGRARLEVLDLNGRRVSTLLDGVLDAGRYAARWSGEDDAGHTVAPGVYFVRLQSAEASASLRLLKLQ